MVQVVVPTLYAICTERLIIRLLTDLRPSPSKHVKIASKNQSSTNIQSSSHRQFQNLSMDLTLRKSPSSDPLQTPVIAFFITGVTWNWRSQLSLREACTGKIVSCGRVLCVGDIPNCATNCGRLSKGWYPWSPIGSGISYHGIYNSSSWWGDYQFHRQMSKSSTWSQLTDNYCLNIPHINIRKPSHPSLLGIKFSLEMDQAFQYLEQD